MPSLLYGDRSEDKLKAVLDAMLHFAKQHVAVLGLHGGSRDSRSLARFGGVPLYECGDERSGGGQKLDCVLTELAGLVLSISSTPHAAPAVSTGTLTSETIWCCLNRSEMMKSCCSSMFLM